MKDDEKPFFWHPFSSPREVKEIGLGLHWNLVGLVLQLSNFQ